MAERDWRQILDGLKDQLAGVKDRLRGLLLPKPELVPVPVDDRPRRRPRQ